MRIFFQQFKISRRFLAAFLAAGLIVAGVLIQKQTLKVSADLQVLLISDTDLPFGKVFPGQVLTRHYAVQLDNSALSAEYEAVLEPVLGQEDLCPHLEIKSIDEPEEGDTLALASLASGSDSLDMWEVKLNTPGVNGRVAQDHTGGIVVTSGGLSCKITIGPVSD